MAKVVKTYSARKNEILNTANQLFYSQGFEHTSIQHIIDQVGIAKGTFYHYFSSKTELLDALIDQLVNSTLEQIEPVLEDPNLDALQKLHQFFLRLENWKLENKKFLLDILRAWYSDDNIVFRTRLEQAQLRSFAQKLALIIEQGNQEGIFSSQHPQETAQISLAIMQDVSHRLLEVILFPEKNSEDSIDVLQQVTIYQTSIEKLLGAPQNSIQIFNPERLKKWF